MDILEDPVFKNKYQKSKLRVKLWESDFMEKYGRRPNKNDIKEADVSIKEAYKMYWKLKTRALEETLLDITFTDDTEANVSIPEIVVKASAAETAEEKKATINEKTKDTENIDPHSAANVKEVHNSHSEKDGSKNVQGVWGDHLNKSRETSPKNKKNLIGRSTSFQLSQNKFMNSSFTKRNPRKSLSMIKLRSKSEKSINAEANATEQTDVDNKDGFDVPEEARPMFGETMKVTYTESKPVAQSINPVQQVIEGHIVNRNINLGWLDRCAKENNLHYPIDSQRLSGTSDSGVESMESSIQSPTETIPALTPGKSVQISDDEDFIYNSDSEEERRNKRIRNFKKRLSDQDSQPFKRLRVDDNLYVNTTPTEPGTFIYSQPDNKAANITGSDNLEVRSNITDVSNDISNDDNNTTNLTSESSKCNSNLKDSSEKKKTNTENATETETAESPEKPVRRKIRRRIKHVSSDDSDPDFIQEDERKTKKKVTKPKQTRSSRSKTAENDGNDDEKRKVVRKPRATRKKKTVMDDEVEEPGDTNAENEREPQVYGIETLRAVPRFAISKENSGDLIQQFSKSVSLATGKASVSVSQTKSGKQLSDKEKLEKKVAEGKVNENFVRINLKKKVFVRGKKNFNFSKYKKNQWKQRKKELASGEGGLDVADFAEKNGANLACFKCGETGHFSRRCPNSKGDDLLPLGEIDEGSQFPTLEEAQKMASQNAAIAHGNRIDRLPEAPSYTAAPNESESTSVIESEDTAIEGDSAESPNENQTELNDLWEPLDEEILCGHKIPEELVSRLLPPQIGVVNPLYGVRSDQSLIETPAEVFETLQMFGHESFRSGQEKAIMRILSGQSTLVTLSTGSGKSLCYQLPAYLYSKHSTCITLVVSPLVSLMDDQVTGVPHFLSAACLHTNQTQKVRDNVMEMVKQGKVNILLVSPEAVVAGEKSTGFGALLRQLPPIAFACIDEAHCISQWSHNFRPSYLMICRVLREKLRVNTVLALTATATKTTAESIVHHIGLHDGMNGVISDIPMPRNLFLTVSKDHGKDQALITLLRSTRFEECDSIIIYCTRREECVRISGLLRTSLQDLHAPERPNVKISAIAEAYHAGLSAYRRKVVQKAFMSGQTKVVVATVAFGMGLNKPDIRAVIHYNMPGTFEGYVQEVGRAGRDGLRAHCHLFLSPAEDSDKWELRRHIYANGVDRHTIRRLLQKVFLPCSCTKLREKGVVRKCPGHEVAIPVDETVSALDVSEEIISTLLCYLELHPKRFITVLSSVYVKAKVSSYAGPQGLKQAAQSSPPLAMAIALDLQKGISHENSSVIEFPVVDIASAIGWDSGVVKSHLKNLEWKTVNGHSKRSSISVRYDTLGLRVKAPGDLTPDELDEALDALHNRTKSQEFSALHQLETITGALHKYSMPSVMRCLSIDEELTSKSEDLKSVIRDYFKSEVKSDGVDVKQQEKIPNEGDIINDVRCLIMSYRDNNFTGRAVARIFHGIQSPNYPAYVWGKCRFWRAHLAWNFNTICQIATREILSLR